MKAEINLEQITRGISHFLHRFHVLIFVITILGGLAVATFMLYNVILSTAPSSTQPPPTTFDKDTIKKVETLRDNNDTPSPLIKPEGRTNPFE